MDFASLLPDFGNIVFTLAAFIVALSVIVAVHEYGHYIVGRWCGIHAEVFSIGFGTVLFSREDRHGTRWQIAALPFGGYVKFLGDANAASVGVDASVSAVDRRRTMNGAPLWARSATVAAGPVFNFIFSIVVFAAYISIQGVATDTPRLGVVHPLPNPVQELREGDLIVSIGDEAVQTLEDFYRVAGQVPAVPEVAYTVERSGQRLSVTGPHPLPPRASGISLQSAARSAGLQTGDVVVAVDGEPVWAFAQLPPIVAESGGAPVAMTIWRDGALLDISLTPRRTDLPTADGGFETRWLIGLQSGPFFEHPVRSPGLAESVPMAVEQTWRVVTNSISGLTHMIKGAISPCNLSGPIGIATTSGAMASEGIWAFIWFIAVLSTAVGLLNLFPIPVLDGGHLVFHAWEAITGKPPGERALGIFMTIGIALLATLMLFAIFTDLTC
jgi:regulator of sigma E protease